MKFAACCAIIFTLNLLAPMWWWIMLVPAIFGLLLFESGKAAFWNGGLAAAALWLVHSIFLYVSGADLVTQAVAEIMYVQSPAGLFAGVAILGLLAGGFAGLGGYAVRVLVRPEWPD